MSAAAQRVSPKSFLQTILGVAEKPTVVFAYRAAVLLLGGLLTIAVFAGNQWLDARIGLAPAVASLTVSAKETTTNINSVAESTKALSLIVAQMQVQQTDAASKLSAATLAASMLERRLDVADGIEKTRRESDSAWRAELLKRLDKLSDKIDTVNERK